MSYHKRSFKLLSAIMRGHSNNHSNHRFSFGFHYFRPPLLFAGFITLRVQEIMRIHLGLFHCLVLSVQDVHGILESFDVPGPKREEGSLFFFCGPGEELVEIKNTGKNLTNIWQTFCKTLAGPIVFVQGWFRIYLQSLPPTFGSYHSTWKIW